MSAPESEERKRGAGFWEGKDKLVMWQKKIRAAILEGGASGGEVHGAACHR